MERNLCVEAACKGACCHDLQMDTRTHPSNFFPKAKEVGNARIHSALPDGVYFYSTPQGHYVRIVGQCPNLLPDSNCGIYEKRPPACRKLEIASLDCNKARERDKIPIIVIPLTSISS